MIVYESKKFVNFAIISFFIMYLIPKESFFFAFSITVIVLFSLMNTKYSINKLKFILPLFSFYALVFIFTGDGITKEYLIGMVRVVGFQFIIVTLCALFVRDYSDLKMFLKSLLIILFVSYIMIGFYQYYTGVVLSPWIDESDILVYTKIYDLNRFRSFLDIHPANSANGILFVICLTFYGLIEKNKTKIIIFTFALIALFLTFTRMAYIAFFLLVLLFVVMNASKNWIKISFAVFILILLIVPLFVVGQDIFSYSIRLVSDINIYGRINIWETFFLNISKYLFGQGYFNNTRVAYFISSSSENYFIQEFINYGVFSIILYFVIIMKFFKNLAVSKPEIEKKTIVLMFFAFVFNMMGATYSQNMLFLVFGLSFSYANVVQNYQQLPIKYSIEK